MTEPAEQFSSGFAAAPESGFAATPDLADLVAEAVKNCSGVVALSSGGRRPVATYLPGRQVSGVHIDDHRIRVGVVGALGMPIPVLAAQIRAALVPYAKGRVVDVDVVDVRPLPASSRTHSPPGLLG